MRKIQILRVNNSRILRIKNAKFSGYYFSMNLNIWGDFQFCISVPLRNKLLIYNKNLNTLLFGDILKVRFCKIILSTMFCIYIVIYNVKQKYLTFFKCLSLLNQFFYTEVILQTSHFMVKNMQLAYFPSKAGQMNISIKYSA